jgi:anti-sigma regulatory factor (Ser/Thr protein kinase)
MENMEPFSRNTSLERTTSKDKHLQRRSQFGTPETVRSEPSVKLWNGENSEKTMQAHSQSSPAARSSYRSSLSSTVHKPVETVALASTETIHSLAQGAGLAHDAGNLLGALGLYCDLLSAPGVLRPEHQHYVSELRQLASRSGLLIQALLVNAPRPDSELIADPAQSLPAAVSPPAIVPNAAETLRAIEPLLSAIAGQSVTVTCKAPRSIASPAFPPEALERILVNLVRNAAQAIEQAEHRRHGNIRIALATVSGRLRLTVEDNGPGMPVTTAASFLSPSPLPKGAMRGLGHRIIHELVTASGGELTLRVRNGRGTTITILWPVPTENHTQPAPATFRSSRRIGASPC